MSSPRSNVPEGPGAAHLCYGKSALFDSTDPGDHMEAARLCRVCPMIQACRLLLAKALKESSQESGHGPEGTWAGKAVGKATTSAVRASLEDAMFTEEEACDAARAYKRGDRDDRARIGARVYERRRVQRQRDRQRERRAA